ncbi:MAG: GHMP kinase, partial [Thermoplasmata archaeon]
FILEGGKENKEEVPPLIAHMDIPDSWRFVIVCPKDIHSFDEVEEKPIMESMKVDRKYPSMISHHIVMGVLPALVSTDIEGFGHHISKIQRLVGRSFAEPQGGIFHPIIADVIEKLEVLTYGAGQSSWGPTGYGITDIENAEDVKDEILGYLDDKELDSHVWIAEPENEGAHFSE